MYTLYNSFEGVMMPAGVALGALDLVVIGGATLLALYWFGVRRRRPDIPEIKKLTVVSPLARRENYDPSFVNKMKKQGRNVVVFFGSQTGTAEEFAGRLSKDAARYGMKGLVCDPEECEMDELCRLGEVENALAIFCVATYGEGDPTDNAQELHDWLKENNGDLAGINYAVFGLGNKTYENYNSMSVFVDKRLEELGATRVHDLGLGDDDGNIEEDFVSWRELLWPAVCEHFGVEATGEDINTREFALEIPENVPLDRVYSGEPQRLRSFQVQKPPFDTKNPYLATVLCNRELHKGGDRSCMHIEFNIEGSRLRYDTGDHVAVYPQNDAALVTGIGTRLGVDLDQVFSLNNIDEDANKAHPFPCPTTYRTALTHYVDITNVPRTNVLKELSEYCAEEADRQHLALVASSSPEGRALYAEWALRDHRHILAVLEDVPSCRPPLDHVLELLPRLQPRYYSISSSPKMHPTSISITAVLIEYTTRTQRTQHGVTTYWLKHKVPAEDSPLHKVPIFVRKSQFRLPFKPSVPIIMVGPGTGFAPFRGFIQDRHVAKEQGKPIGDIYLYFGCRHAREDFLYEDEIENFKNTSTLKKVYTAFSRDGSQKVYVQDLLRQNGAETWKLLEEGAHVYVCGDARLMAPDVDKALCEIVQTHGALTSEKAGEYLKRMRSRGRYSCDVWS